MKIKKLKIEQFRHLTNIEMDFGERITAIAGQNGTGKSSMLGIIGHIFTYTKTEEQKKIKTISNNYFETVYSEIFKFAYPDYDKPKEHKYEIDLDNGESIPASSYDRIEKGKPRSLRFRVRKSEAGEGKIVLPVIFLGLRRLFPLAQEEKVIHNPTLKLTKEEIELYQKFHNDVLILREIIDPELIEVSNKIYYSVKTNKYNAIGNSAGQDNIGQIITALLSFRRLKNSVSDYSGGILLIDELDATLYPGAQIKLIENLFSWAQKLNLQIIFTTHSLEILNTLFKDEYQFHSKVIYLADINGDGKVSNYQSKADIKKITADLIMLPAEKEYYSKIPVFCEDEEARLWLSNILIKDNKQKIQILNENFGGDELVHWARKRVKFFKESIFVLDGDKTKKIKRSNKCPRIIFLPGDESPEKIFYKFLNTDKANLLFDSELGGFNKRTCFKDLNVISDDRDKMKNWMKSQKKYLGKGYKKLFNMWKINHKKEVEKFNLEFTKIIEKIKNIN